MRAFPIPAVQLIPGAVLAVFVSAALPGCATVDGATHSDAPAAAPSDAADHGGAASPDGAAPDPPPRRPAAGTDRIGDGYYLSACARCGRSLGMYGDVSQRCYEGREVVFCREQCRAEFEADQAHGFSRLDAVMIADQKPLYPTDRSIVSGAPLGTDAVDVMWTNRLVRLASPSERERLVADPSAVIAELDRAVIEFRVPRYTITKCLVQGVELTDENTADVVVANRLFRVCCLECARRIRALPRARIPAVDYAWAHAHEASAP